jgi:hypothetical protein
MPFLNQDIITPSLNSTSLTATTFYSGSTELSQVSIPQNRFLLNFNRTPVNGSGGATIQTVTFTYTIPAGTISPGNSLEIYVMGNIISTNLSSKLVAVKFGTANTISDTSICAFSTSTNTPFGFMFLSRVTFVSDNLLQSSFVQSNSGAWGNGTFTTASTFSLSSTTTYITITTTKAAFLDTITIRNSDVFINTQ